jgi:hypothetical protein
VRMLESWWDREVLEVRMPDFERTGVRIPESARILVDRDVLAVRMPESAIGQERVRGEDSRVWLGRNFSKVRMPESWWTETP